MSSKLLNPTAATSPAIREISDLCDQVTTAMRTSVAGALHVGLRLLVLHRETGQLTDAPGGFRAALAAIADRVPRSTAYRWINAATAVLAAHQGICDDKGIFDPAEVTIAAPGTAAWTKLEKVLTERAQGMSLKRLLIGSAATSEESRFDALLTADESGDKHATAILEQVAEGKLTLVQAIRALGGAKTKDKHRTDPVYLDIDGATGQPTGLFPKCLITLANTFSQWDRLPEAARKQAKASWKELVSQLPKELR